MIKDIEIVDYKGFKNLKLENLSQINIISGENNIGKTALLEALFLYKKILLDYDFLGALLSLNAFLFIARNRNVHENRIKRYLQNIDFIVNSSKLKIDIKYKSSYELNKREKEEIKKLNQDYSDFIISYINDSLDLFPVDNISMENIISHNYIDSSKPTNQRLVKLYSNIQSKGIQHKFLNYLKLLDSDIEWIEPQLLDDEMLLRLNLNNPERSLLSSELGEGTNRYIEILCTLLSNSGGTVFIDEIENGIHYTKLYDIWKAILEIVEKEKIQLFVTTHNLESIEALNEASEAMNFDKITSVKLQKDENNVIYPVVRNYSSFVATVDSGMDIR
jgi:AAA15 family ATPase/GTPase